MNIASRKSVNLLRARIICYRSSVSKLNTNVFIFENQNRSYFSDNKIFVLNKSYVQFIRRCFADFPKHKVINLPNLSPTMETGSVVSWGRKEGEAIAEGDLLAEIETDKATMSLDADDPGFMAKILVAAGTRDIPIGTPLCVVVEEEEHVAAFKDFKSSDAPSKSAEKKQPPVATPPQSVKPVESSKPAPPSVTPANTFEAPASGQRVVASPYAKKLAAEKGINLSNIKGSGPSGRIVANDLDGAVSGGVQTFQSKATGAQIPVDAHLTNLAARLAQSKREIPHYHLTVEISMDRLLAARKQLNESRKDSVLSVTDFVVKAAAKACQDIPQANSEWQGNAIRQYSNVDISLGVATQDSFVTPVIYDAERKGLNEINHEINTIIEKTKSNKVTQEDIQGGTFTVTNLGTLGVNSFSAVINPPQACVLAIGCSQNKVVIDAAVDKGYRQSVVMEATLVCDHRIVDGAVGAQWLKAFRKYMEEPANMLL